MSHKNKGKKKSTKLEVQKRAAIVFELDLIGYSDHEILEYVNSGGKSGRNKKLMWDISFSTLRYYMRVGRDAHGNITELDIKKLMSDAIKRWTFIIRKCHREQDNTNLIKATKELDEILGLKTKNINISGLLNVNDVTDLTEEELDKAILEAEEALTK